jgi:hypothetical protein
MKIELNLLTPEGEFDDNAILAYAAAMHEAVGEERRDFDYCLDHAFKVAEAMKTLFDNPDLLARVEANPLLPQPDLPPWPPFEDGKR